MISQGNNKRAIQALQAPSVKSNPHSFGIQVSFEDVLHVLNSNDADASIKAIYVELLQGQLHGHKDIISRLWYHYNMQIEQEHARTITQCALGIRKSL